MKVLIIGLSNLGDAFLTYPAIHAVWAAYPEAQFHLLASSRTRELFETDPRVNRVWIWKKQAWFPAQIFLIARLAFERYDLVVDFRNSLIPLFLLGAKRAPIFQGSPPAGEHRSQTHLNQVAALGISPSAGGHRLLFGSKEEKEVQEWLEPGHRLVVMVPGARSHLKRWSAPGFARVADRLVAEQNAQVILVGETAERPIAEEVRAHMRQPATDRVGQTTLFQLAALLARASLSVTNDSACLHAAELMGVPSVAIFGPTDEKKYGPQNPRSVVVRRSLVCAPCERALCPYGHECMNWIEAEEVYAAAVRILNA